MRDGAATKERIGRTAMRLFVEKGLAETTIRDIAAGAGVAEGTMYRHYASKEALAADLYEGDLIAFAGDLADRCRAHRGIEARNAAMIRHICAFFDSDRVLFSYLLLSRNSRRAGLAPEMRHPMDVVLTAIVEGMDAGEIPRRDSVVVTSMCFGLVREVAMSHLEGHIDGPMSDLADTLVAASWRVLGA
jgi:AcrR family transcriptional regulator